MERDFDRPRVGDVFEIKKSRRSAGGYPLIHVESVDLRRYSMMVRDSTIDGRYPEVGAPPDVQPRKFSDEAGWPKLRRYWKRHRG